MVLHSEVDLAEAEAVAANGRQTNMNTTRIGNFTISFDNSEEFHTIKREIFNNDIYWIDPKHITNITTPLIVDLGAHIGLATLYFKQQFPDNTILALEPYKNNFDLLVCNVNQNGLKNITCINKAIANKSGKTIFYVDTTDTNWFSTGGFTQNAWNNRQITKQIEVDCISLDDLVRQNSIEHIDILKVDIEGFEQSLFKNNSKALSITDNVIFEFHRTKFQDLNKIDKILRKSGFSRVSSTNNKLDDNELSIEQYTRKR